MKDLLGRDIDYLRISVTDRCNLRCMYCQPDGIRKISMHNLLTYEQIAQLCRAAVSLGITKFRITGGEPLVRRGVEKLVQMIHAVPGTQSVTMTTNGVLLRPMIPILKAAGLSGVNISLDSLCKDTFSRITGSDALQEVLAGIDAALESGLDVKINAVLQKGVNEDDWWNLISLAEHRPVSVRFIEMMPIGCGRQRTGIGNDFLLHEIEKLYPAVRRENGVRGNGPAEYYAIPGFSGTVGFISALSNAFCRSCNRIRLTSTGLLKPCLCFADGVETKPLFDTLDDSELEQSLCGAIMQAIRLKPQGHHFEDIQAVTETRRMVEIGG